jgi:hypothetical protein
MLPSESPHSRSRSSGVSTWRATTEPGTFGAYSPIFRMTRSPSVSRIVSQVPSFSRYGTYCTKQVMTWRPGGARLSSTLVATTQSTQSSAGTTPVRASA